MSYWRWTLLNKIQRVIAFLIIAILITVSSSLFYRWYSDLSALSVEREPEPQPQPSSAEVWVGGEVFTFNPAEVETTRSDLFNAGYFSMFDVLVHLGERGLLDLVYHFNNSINTHVIDSINGERYWWYESFYDGGWPERNVFRPDHYPWKPETTLKFFKTNPSALTKIHNTFAEEESNRPKDGSSLIIPKVIIESNTFTKQFENVRVTPHNLRSDVFKENVTTALDVIMSLGDREEITYELKWYDSLGSAEIVRSYWVEAIDGDTAHGGCGFVYEAGFWRNQGSGNHIHLPSDTRIINAPEYVLFYWICIPARVPT